MTPSPKEKAEELILMYLRACDNKDGWFNTSLAKKAAIIAVDEIIDILTFDLGHDQTARKLEEHWQEVKNELLKQQNNG